MAQKPHTWDDPPKPVQRWVYPKEGWNGSHKRPQDDSRMTGQGSKHKQTYGTLQPGSVANALLMYWQLIKAPELMRIRNAAEEHNARERRRVTERREQARVLSGWEHEGSTTSEAIRLSRSPTS